jgi:hypothetical protein
MALVGAGAIGGAAAGIHKHRADRPMVLTGIFLGAIGVFVLDGPQGAGLELAPVTGAEASLLGMNLAEARAYNDSLDELNVATQSVALELSRMENPSDEDAAALWKSIGSELEQDALRAMAKVVRAL